MRRKQTETIQTSLAALGYDPGKIDGWWGPRTTAAARAVLQDTRRSWAYTWTAVRHLQIALTDLGYEPGKIDGIWGPRTAAALALLVAGNGEPMAGATVMPGAAVVYHEPAKPEPAGRILQAGRYTVREIVLHTAATSSDWWRGKTNQRMWDEVKDWHTTPVSRGGRGWSDRGYHWGVFPDGGRLPGRAQETIGAHVSGHNLGTLGIMMVPVKTISRMGTILEFYTPETVATTKALIAEIAKQTPIQIISGHNEYAAKLCPGFVVQDRDWLP